MDQHVVDEPDADIFAVEELPGPAIALKQQGDKAWAQPQEGHREATPDTP